MSRPIADVLLEMSVLLRAMGQPERDRAFELLMELHECWLDAQSETAADLHAMYRR